MTGARAWAMVVAAGLAIASLTQAEAETGAIFMYHHVSPVVQPGLYQRALTVSPSEFEQQLRWLRSRGCELVTVDRIWSDALHSTLAPCEAALTFDDGYVDVARYAVPAMVRYGAQGTLYVSTGLIGQWDHMSVSDVRRSRSEGMEIGAHTVHHVDLTQISHAEALDEINGSQKSLTGWTGHSASTFAYPAGSFNADIAGAVARAHFLTAVTTQPGTLGPGENAYALPRYRIVRGQGIALFASVFGDAAQLSNESLNALQHIARQRIEGNDLRAAETVAVALLARRFPEQILKVHVVALAPATVVGIVLSGVKFHAAINRERLRDDVRKMIDVAFAAAPAASEVDVWATVPIAVPAGTPVSGDYAAPAEKTVFSAAVVKAAYVKGNWSLGEVYWDERWL